MFYAEKSLTILRAPGRYHRLRNMHCSALIRL